MTRYYVEVTMSDVTEAIRGAIGLIFSGFILLVFAQAIAGTTLDTGIVDIGLIGLLALLGGVVVIVTIVGVIVGEMLT
jgi:hypothetical protein